MAIESITQRNQRVAGFFKSTKVLFPIILIIIIILGAYIRLAPMRDHGVNPGLWDITTNDWTLGPDLDPWLFVKNAKIIAEDGSIPAIDTSRNVPLGYDNSRETVLMPYLIFYTYTITNIFTTTDVNMEFAGAILPVILFAFTTLFFFMFVKEVFKSKGTTRSSVIASISTFIFILMPQILARTVAGIPEKEAAGLLFLFLSLWLFLKSWNTKNTKLYLPLALLAGISTALMRLAWGGAIYLFAVISITVLLSFLFNGVTRRNYIAYTLWMFSSFFTMVISSSWFTLRSLVTLPYTGVCLFIFMVLTINIILWDTSISKLFKNFPTKYTTKYKSVISLIVSGLLLIPFILIIFGYQFILDTIKLLYELLFNPISGRWNTTVAENRPPFFGEWANTFGPLVGNIRILFSLFLIGSVFLFREITKKLNGKIANNLTIVYIILLAGIIFTRLSAQSIFNGSNLISNISFIGSIVLFIVAVLWASLIRSSSDNEGSENINQYNFNFNYILVTIFLILSLFTIRSAIRLIIVLAAVVPLFVGYLLVEVYSLYKKVSEESKGKSRSLLPLLLGTTLFILVIATVFAAYENHSQITYQAYNHVPNHYTQQWQKGMEWVRTSTPLESVFGHWWDYGYWIQAIGERATVLDGGNVITYWNYLMGRHVLTGDNQDDALEFLYNHNATHLLIDSSDIGKYGAYASIGSNKDMDRSTIVPTIFQDPSQTLETKEGFRLVYPGGLYLEEDILYDNKLFTVNNAYIQGVIIDVDKDQVVTNSTLLILSKNIIYYLPLRYTEFNNILYDQGKGIPGTLKIITRVGTQGEVSQAGAAIYISPRVTKTLFNHLFLLNDPMDKFPNFKITHIEENLIYLNAKSQGLELGEFFYYDPIGLQGPIKIWDIKYTGKEKMKEEYLDTDPNKYLDWKL